MNVQLTFAGASTADVLAQMKAFIAASDPVPLSEEAIVSLREPAPEFPLAEEKTPAAVEIPAKPKRKRRTKAEMAEARGAAAARGETPAKAEPVEAEPVEEPVVEAPVVEAPAPTSRRRGAAKPAEPVEAPVDNITNADLAKAASEAAERIDTGAVAGILEQFGVTRIDQLYETQRREFLDAVAAI